MTASAELDLFGERVIALLEAADPRAVGALEHRTSKEILTFSPSSETGLPIKIEISPTAIAVWLDTWKHVEVLAMEGDAEERTSACEGALDLVGTGLYGLASVRVESVRQRPFRWTIGFGPAGERRAFTSIRRLRWPPWGRAEVIERTNHFRPPADLQLGEIGRLPTAPWIGALQWSAEAPAPRSIPLDGELDLHLFPPRDVPAVVREYLDACLEQGVVQLRIVHGKGKGMLRRTVHAILDRHPAVADYRLGGMGEGSWGATVVTLAAGSSDESGRP